MFKPGYTPFAAKRTPRIIGVAVPDLPPKNAGKVKPVAPSGTPIVVLPALPSVFCITKTLSAPFEEAVKSILVPALIRAII